MADLKNLKEKIQNIDKEKIKTLTSTHKVLFGAGLVGILFLIAILFYAYGPLSGNKEEFTVLFSNLNPPAVEEVVKELSKEGIPFKVSSDGKTISVPKDKVYALRISLLSKGIPSSGNIGFDLFREPKFGMSRYQMRILYQQALANEIRKAIESLEPVKSASVVISLPEESDFLSDEETKASVVVNLYPGEKLSKEQVKGIVNLLVKSVKGLKVENVSVVDQFGNDLLEGVFETSSSDEVENRLRIKRKYEKELEKKVTTLLSKVFGTSRVSVKASVDLDFTQEEISEHFYDPDKSAVVSEEREKETSKSKTPASGIPGTASNLPPPVGRDFDVAAELGLGKNLGNAFEKKKTIINYNTGEIKRRRIISSPKIKRITVSVLVSGSYEHKNGKLVYIPINDDELQEIEKAVKTAVGYDPRRGDMITVATLPFNKVAKEDVKVIPEETVPVGTVEGISRKFGLPPKVIYALIALILTLLFAALISVYWWRKQKEKEASQKALEELLSQEPILVEGENKEALEELIEKGDIRKTPLTLEELAKLVPGLKVEDLKYEPESIKIDKALTAILQHIEAKIKEDPKKAAEIIRKWINS